MGLYVQATDGYWTTLQISNCYLDTHTRNHIVFAGSKDPDPTTQTLYGEIMINNTLFRDCKGEDVGTYPHSGSSIVFDLPDNTTRRFRSVQFSDCVFKDMPKVAIKHVNNVASIESMSISDCMFNSCCYADGNIAALENTKYDNLKLTGNTIDASSRPVNSPAGQNTYDSAFYLASQKDGQLLISNNQLLVSTTKLTDFAPNGNRFSNVVINQNDSNLGGIASVTREGSKEIPNGDGQSLVTIDVPSGGVVFIDYQIFGAVKGNATAGVFIKKQRMSYSVNGATDIPGLQRFDAYYEYEQGALQNNTVTADASVANKVTFKINNKSGVQNKYSYKFMVSFVR